MARPGVTDPQILAAIEALRTRGEPITKLTVRQELGNTGSYGTISAFLQRWREAQPPQPPDPVAPAIPEAILPLFARAWASARTLAQTELAQQREAMTKEMDDLRQATTKAQAENDEAVRILEVQLETQAAQLNEAVSQERAARSHQAEITEQLGFLKGKLEATEAAMADIRSKLERKESRVLELEEQLKEARIRRAEADASTGSSDAKTKVPVEPSS